jgi:hypothetical protein
MLGKVIHHFLPFVWLEDKRIGPSRREMVLDDPASVLMAVNLDVIQRSFGLAHPASYLR